ncbi:Bifunctional protein FolD [Clostridium bornimense]|uniref:Bifunctional protein FolD n=1 Tax=Clostridium bornimense TaxID=1216932 RepID=W6RW49_9CLOT|nr:tetrahydrofolate dehydrogenase/cyclohydrolase catalytic domain-containing protein [Clostridium bornimense]CDM68613.1 Bifunctional protein FolD [Clostridium bornimense]
MGAIIDVKSLVSKFQNEIMAIVNEKKNKGEIVSIGILQVGKDGGSNFYRNSVVKLSNKLGIEPKEFLLEENVSEEEIISVVNEINNDNNITGVLMLLPMPKGIDSDKVKEALSPSKDIDGVTTHNIGQFYSGNKAFIPCTPLSVMEILRSVTDLEGKEAVVIGRSNVVGKPLAQLLLNANCTVTTVHSRTKNIEEVCRRADILVSAIGKPKYINSNFIKDGAVVIDVGTSDVEGKITGDVDLEDVIEKVSYITKVPGGVGSLTTTILLKNLCEGL